MRFLTGAIHTETAEYARIAQNLVAAKGYIGMHAEGTELMFPPLFPLLIMIASRAIHDWQMASQCISIIMGTLLILPVFFICRLLYDDNVAKVAALLVGLHPLLLHISAQGLSEGPYLTLLMVGIYYSLRAFGCSGPRHLLLAGMFFGLAYLTRPEAFMYPFFATALVMLAVRQQGPRATLHAGLLLVSFLVVATPYIAFLSSETGHIRVEGKSAVIHFLNQRKAAGESQHAIGEDLREEGGWMRTQRSLVDEADATFATGLRYAAGAAGQNVLAIVDTLVAARWLGSPALFALAIIGLFRRHWTRELTKYQAMLLVMVLLQTLALLWKATNFRTRYYSVFLPILIVWAAKGVIEVSRWARTTVLMFTERTGISERVGGLVRWASTGALLVLAGLAVSHLGEVRTFGPESRIYSDAGAWLKSVSPGAKTVMDGNSSVAFHAGASYVSFPECDSAVAVRYVDKKKIDFIVLRTGDIPKRRYYQDWLQDGIPDRRAQLVYSRRTATFGVLIFRWNAQGPAPVAAAF